MLQSYDVGQDLLPLLERALAARSALFEPRHQNAFRLFNGFLEGWPDLAVDLYATTVVLFDHSEFPGSDGDVIHLTAEFLRGQMPWLKAGLVKKRNGTRQSERKGVLLFGDTPDCKIRENGAWYALDLCLNQDASLYLDTRNLRLWALEHLQGRTVLNAFAYTGSLGVAACAGGAVRVVQLDLNRQFLNIAKTSYTLNGFSILKDDFVTGDFWSKVSHFKRTGERFDCIFLDPPYYSATSKGRLDLGKDSARLINKVRPLINHGGFLVAVNNALYVSGRQYMQTLEELCEDGYLKIIEKIAVPPDFIGYLEPRLGTPITDPTPFNHSTKIAVLEVRRKE